MKLVRNLTATLILACALAVNAYAGDQQTPPECTDCTPPATSTTDSDKTTDYDEPVSEPSDDSDFWYDTLMALLSVY